MASAKGQYIPSLDGLRAVSVAIVFIAHAGLAHVVPGGFGVTVFFFLSGYLITSLLLEERTRVLDLLVPPTRGDGERKREQDEQQGETADHGLPPRGS